MLTPALAALSARGLARRLVISLAVAALVGSAPIGSAMTSAASVQTASPVTAAAATITRTFTVVATRTSMRLSGRWLTYYNYRLIGGKGLKSSLAGATLSYTFLGNRIALIGPKGPRGGSARIYIDGHYARTVSERSSLSYSRVTLFARNFTTSGRHTITVRATTASFIVNALQYRRPVATAPATARVVTVGPSETVSAFRALAADTSIGVIEMAAGTYHGWREANLPDRTGHPLIIRPVAGATVVFDAASDGNYPDHAFGMLNASYITLDGTPGRFVFQHYILAQDGMFLLMNASHITIKGLTFSHIAGNANTNNESTHLFYISDGVSYLDIEDVVASNLQAGDEPGGVHGVNGLQFYTGGTGAAIHNVTVKNVRISNANWAVVVRNGTTGLLFDGVTASDCGHGGVPAVLDFGGNNTGTIRNSTTTLSATRPSLLGVMTNGGGNSFN